jgi:hypothetical protein
MPDIISIESEMRGHGRAGQACGNPVIHLLHLGTAFVDSRRQVAGVGGKALRVFLFFLTVAFTCIPVAPGANLEEEFVSTGPGFRRVRWLGGRLDVSGRKVLCTFGLMIGSNVKREPGEGLDVVSQTPTSFLREMGPGRHG